MSLAEDEPGADTRSPPPVDRNVEHRTDDRRVIELYHVQLPKLVEAELIEWDRETNNLQRGQRFDEVEPLLAVLRNIHEETREEDAN